MSTGTCVLNTYHIHVHLIHVLVLLTNTNWNFIFVFFVFYNHENVADSDTHYYTITQLPSKNS